MASADSLSNLEDMVIRLDWLCMSLSGTEDEEGLIPQINRLFMEGDSPSGDRSGLIPRLEAVYEHGDALLGQLARVSDVIEQPIGDEQRKSIRQAIRSAIKEEVDGLHAELADVAKAARLASERITESAAKSEILVRSTQAGLEQVEERLQQTVPDMAEQMRAMVGELGDLLSTDKIRGPLESNLREVLATLSVDHQKGRLHEAWSEVMDKFVHDLSVDMAQHREAMEMLLVESQQEQMARVKKIVDSRTPSETIVSLFDELDLAKSQLAKYEKNGAAQQAQVASGRSQSFWWVVIAAAVGGGIIGAGGIMAYLLAPAYL